MDGIVKMEIKIGGFKFGVRYKIHTSHSGLLIAKKNEIYQYPTVLEWGNVFNKQ